MFFSCLFFCIPVLAGFGSMPFSGVFSIALLEITCSDPYGLIQGLITGCWKQSARSMTQDVNVDLCAKYTCHAAKEEGSPAQAAANPSHFRFSFSPRGLRIRYIISLLSPLDPAVSPLGSVHVILSQLSHTNWTAIHPVGLTHKYARLVLSCALSLLLKGVFGARNLLLIASRRDTPL